MSNVHAQLSINSNKESKAPTRRELIDVYEVEARTTQGNPKKYTEEDKLYKLNKKTQSAIDIYVALMITSIVLIFASVTLYICTVLIPQYKDAYKEIKYSRFLGGKPLSKNARQKMCTIM